MLENTIVIIFTYCSNKHLICAGTSYELEVLVSGSVKMCPIWDRQSDQTKKG